jgi:acetolactate synthase-1/2/3 large subunit
MSSKITGGQAVVRTLQMLGVSTVFSVSGNQVLPIYDAARDAGVRLIHMRHESAAAFAAAGMSELTGQPGVLLTSAGPAFLAALTGVGTVRAMELPLIFLSGASPVNNSGYGNFQELDQATTCRSVCKASLNAASVESIPGILKQAWDIAQEEIPGPVHVSLPADVLLSSVDFIPAVAAIDSGRMFRLEKAPGEIEVMAMYLLEAERPMVIVRPSAYRGQLAKLADRLARQLGVQPLVTGAPRALADAKYAHLLPHYKRSDCALIVGPSDYALGFLDESIIAENGKILLIDAAGDPAPRRKPTVHICYSVSACLELLVQSTADYRVRDREWSRLWSAPLLPEPRPAPHDGPVHPLEVAAQIRDVLQPDDILAVDGGEFCQWIRFGLKHISNRWLWNSKFGLIGNSIPMALGVSTHGHSGRTIAIMGDGGAGYHLLEFETAARYGIPFVAIIGNDARWGAEWHLQASRYGPERTFDTELSLARYDVAASGLGAVGFYAPDTVSLRRALGEALGCGKPACINVEIQSVRSSSVPP